MKLRELQIKNFKSIEDATIVDIGDIDVLCGKNNSGKSAIFEVLRILRGAPVYPSVTPFNIPRSSFTGADIKKSIEFRIVFELEPDDRQKVLEDMGINVTQLAEIKDASQEGAKILNSNLFNRIEYFFKSNPNSTNAILENIRITDYKGDFANIAVKEGNIFHVSNFRTFAKSLNNFSKENIEVRRGNVRLNLENCPYPIPFELYNQAFKGFYSFLPNRSSKRRLNATETTELNPDGSNLVQRLFSMKHNEEDLWFAVKEFAENALPNTGQLISSLMGGDTEIHFRSKKWKIKIDIHDMGSGVEQLLMIATVLVSANNSLILAETPEEHLHHGAQRKIVEFIRSNLKGNQVLIATHSPVFLNLEDIQVHIVNVEQGTKIKKVDKTEDFSQALSELGCRNSDLLLADSVCFVEGPSDERILKCWAKTLDVDFESKNQVFLHIFGCRNLDYYANSELLKKISQRSPVPSFFVIDRDEKSEDTIQKIRKQINNLHIFEKREIENYLLLPEPILEAMQLKAESNPKTKQQLASVTASEIEEKLESAIRNSKPRVLLKMVKEELGGGPFLENIDFLSDSDKKGDDYFLPNKLVEAVKENLAERCGEKRIREIFKQKREAVNKIWENPDINSLKSVVSGKEILKSIFESYGLSYNNVKDGEKIAAKMNTNDIDKEIVKLLTKKLPSMLNP